MGFVDLCWFCRCFVSLLCIVAWDVLMVRCLVGI